MYQILLECILVCSEFSKRFCSFSTCALIDADCDGYAFVFVAVGRRRLVTTTMIHDS